MINLKRILLPTDFSEYSNAATIYACSLAEQFSAELHVLHVLETYPNSTPMFGGGLALTSYIKESRKAAERAIKDVLNPAWAESHSVTEAIKEGPPLVEIVRYSKEHDIDLIVLATHGRSGLEHVLMGSVAEKVVRKAPCPVLTVRPKGHQFVMP